MYYFIIELKSKGYTVNECSLYDINSHGEIKCVVVEIHDQRRFQSSDCGK